MALEIVSFESAKYLTDPQDQVELITEAFDIGDAAAIRKALDIVARARGMSRVAADAGVTREGAYKALGPDGDPKFSTVLGILAALGVKLSAAVNESKGADVTFVQDDHAVGFTEVKTVPAGAHASFLEASEFRKRFYALARSKGYAPDERTLDMIREVQSEFAAGKTTVGPAESAGPAPQS